MTRLTLAAASRANTGSSRSIVPESEIIRIADPAARSRPNGIGVRECSAGPRRGTMTTTRTIKIAAAGILAKKAARQDQYSVSPPARAGPVNAAAAQTIASAPNTFGTSRDGNSSGISA